MNENISKKIKFFSWVMTLLIVLYHIKSIDNYNIINTLSFDKTIVQVYLFCSNLLGYIALTFFFFFSGFWLYNETHNFKILLNKIIKRIKTLFIPFLFWNTFIIIFQSTFFNYDYSFNFTEILKIYFFSPALGSFWYILALLIYLSFSPILFFCYKNRRGSKFFFLLLIFLFIMFKYGVVSNSSLIDSWWWYRNLFNYLPVYLLGGFTGIFYSKYILQKNYNNYKYKLLGILLIMESILLTLFKNSNTYILISLFLLIGIWLIIEPNFFKNKIKSFFSSSFYIYALHQQVWIPLFNKFNYLNLIDVSIYFVMIFKLIQLTFIIILSYLVQKLFKYMLSNNFYNLISGGRG